MKLDIQLSSELQQFVDANLRAGHFASASELISAALQYLKESETPLPEDAHRIAELKKQVSIGIVQADSGQFVDFDAEKIKAEGRAQQSARNKS